MRAETLGLMLQKLGVEQVIAAGGSGGARDSIIFTIMWPDLVRKLAVWSIVGGTYSTIVLANVYVINELRTVRSHGIEGVLEMPGAAGSWADLVAVNPRNRDRLLAIGSEEFERVMNRWLDAFVPKPNEAIPGVPDYEFENVRCPTLIIRGGAKDYDHPPRTSYEVHSADRWFPADRAAVARGRVGAGVREGERRAGQRVRSLGPGGADPARLHRRAVTASVARGQMR